MLANGIVYNRFDVSGLPPQKQLLGYWEQLGQIVEVVPSRKQVRQPFICINDRYDIGEFRISDTYTDHVMIERTAARISRDNARGTIYRLFEHEGGLGAYIRHLRLRAAADELVRFPGVPVKDVGYSVGFKSVSDFTRAFRRAYEMTPQEVRLNDYRYLRVE